MSPPLAYRRRLSRQNGFLLNWCADDLTLLLARSGQVGTFARAATDSVVTSTAPVTVAQHQPSWATSALGVTAQMLPSACAWSFTCDFYLQPLWAYVAGYVGTTVGTGTSRLLRIGDGTNPTFDLLADFTSSGYSNIKAQYVDGSGAPVATQSTAATVGTYVEYLLQADAAYKMTTAVSVALGAQATSALSSAGVAYPATTNLHGSVIKVADSANTAYFQYRQILIGVGAAPTLVQIRALAR